MRLSDVVCFAVALYKSEVQILTKPILWEWRDLRGDYSKSSSIISVQKKGGSFAKPGTGVRKGNKKNSFRDHAEYDEGPSKHVLCLVLGRLGIFLVDF